MKKIALSSVLLSITLFANGQFAIGPKVGLGVSNMKENGEGATNYPKWNYSPTLGLDTKTSLGEVFYIQAALQVTMMGYRTENNGVKNTTYLGYLQIPVKLNVQYKVSPKVYVGFGVGPYFGYYVGGAAKDNSVPNSDGYRIKSKNTVSKADQRSAERVGYVKPLDWGIVAAPFVQIGCLQIAPTVTVGMMNTNPYAERGFTLTQKNLYYGLQFSFLIGDK